MENKKQDEPISLAVGGQALIEGIMMRGPEVTSIAVRKTDGEIVKDIRPINSKIKKLGLNKIPFIRGIFNFGSSLVIGTKALMFSASFFDPEIEEEKPTTQEEIEKEQKAKEAFDNIKNGVIWLSAILGLALSIGLFIILPNVISSFIVKAEDNVVLYNAVESLLKFAIFLGYLLAVSQMKDIKRVFEYHGAEHKTIFCYENNLELTVENIKKQSRFHPRCGTNFMIIVLIISAIIFSLIGRNPNIFINIGYRLLLLPIIAGISYEVIKLAGKSKSKFMKIITAPGLWLQRLTTREPDEKQIEVAIEALKGALPNDNQGVEN